MNLVTWVSIGSGVATIAAAIVAAYYSYLTRRLVLQNKDLIGFNQDQVEQQQRPYIDVSVIVPDGIPILQLRIANSGVNAARDVILKVAPDFYMYGNKSETSLLQKAGLFSRKLPSLAPKAEFLFDLHAAYADLENLDGGLNPSILTVTATYMWLHRNYTEETTLDLAIFRGSMVNSSALLDEAKKLNENVSKLVVAPRSEGVDVWRQAAVQAGLTI